MNHSKEVVGKVTKVFNRDDGSQVRVVAENFALAGSLENQVGYYVHRRNSVDDQWVLCGDRPHKNWRDMSIQEYEDFGRAEVFQVLSHGEILGVLNMIGQPLSGSESYVD